MIGDEFVTIREIQSKYVRAFQDCLDHFRQRFPDEHFLQKVDVGDPNNPDLTGLLDTLSERSKHIELCYEKYVNNPCSIYFLAKMIGRNEFETTQSLATDPKYMVKCYQTNPAELERRAEQGVSSKIVLDLSAVISITLAGGWEHLDPNKQYVVSQMTKELIDSWVREDDENLGSSDDSITQEAKQHRYSILRLDANCASSGLIRFMQQQLSKNCEFRSSMRLAGLAAR